jgi:hypothetical protein
MPTTTQSRCGQFTFYFSKCRHATSHNYHRPPNSGADCNSNCLYDRKIDYWFWAGKDKRCSFCGLGQEHGFGTQHPIPDDEGQRLILFEKMKEGMVLSEPDDVYNERFDEAAAWYNQKALEAIALADARAKEQNPSSGRPRTQRRLRFKNRREIRRLRAKRRTERWVQNVRDEQYAAVKENMEVGKQPFIIGEVGNPYMDLLSEVAVISLPQPMDNCAICQYPLNHVRECGNPYCVPCGHMFHLHCLEELFDRRTDSEEKEVYKCPLCNTWFGDLRKVPNFYDQCRSYEKEFDSDASSSELSDSEDEEEIGDPPPPWIFRPDELGDVPEWLENRTRTRSNARLREIVQGSIASRVHAETAEDDSSLSQPRCRPGTRALLNHFGIIPQASTVEANEHCVPERNVPGISENNSTRPSSSTETESGSLFDSGSGTVLHSPRTPGTARGQGRKRKPKRAPEKRDHRPRKRRRQ